MKKLYLTLAAGIFFLTSVAQLNSNCGGNRYHDFIFPSPPTLTSDIVYGSNLTYSGATKSLKLDVYQPNGDVASDRALVIMVHGGSFIGGNKTDANTTSLCKDLAKMGYVVASIEYRTGMTNFPFGAHTVDSADAGAAVMRATHDGRAAVRFFRKNVAVGGNTYKIDTNNIFLGGVSAGGFVALHVAYMDKPSEFPDYLDTTGVTVGNKTGQPGMHGGFEGLSGNPGYSSKVKAIVNIAGAIGDTAWMSTGDTPVLNFHGTNDQTVPFGTSMIYLSPPSSYPLMKVSGSESIAARANEMGIPNCFNIYWGQDHIPHQSNTHYYDTTIVVMRNFLEQYTCGTAPACNYTTALGVNEVASEADFSVCPNPATSTALIDLTAFSGHSVNIELVDVLGQKVKNNKNIKTSQFVISRDNLPRGIYFINIISEGKKISKKIIFE